MECAICFGSMKYINKYIDKGGDCRMVSIHDHHDEVGNILMVAISLLRKLHGVFFNFTCTVKGSVNLKIRILIICLLGQEPNVVRLQIHLPHEQFVVFNPSQTAEDIVER
jgi:hypothetical protein